jgi:hypothetical protein
LQFEIETSKKMPGRKILYKREHLDLMHGNNVNNEISKANNNILTSQVDFMTTYTQFLNSRRKFNKS